MTLAAAIGMYPHYYLEAVAVEITDRAVHDVLFAGPHLGAQTPERIRILRNWLEAYGVLQAVPRPWWDRVSECCLDALCPLPCQGQPGAPTNSLSGSVAPPFRTLVDALHALGVPNVRGGGILKSWASLASKALWLKYPQNCFLYDGRVTKCLLNSMEAEITPVNAALVPGFRAANAARGRPLGARNPAADDERAYMSLVDAMNVLHVLYVAGGHVPAHLPVAYPTLTTLRLLDKVLYYWKQ